MTVILTPTEDLIMEVLAARTRLGETMWTFDSRHKPTLQKLESRGLVRTMHGTVEKSIRASLTDDALKDTEYMSPSYEAPILKKYKLKKKYR